VKVSAAIDEGVTQLPVGVGSFVAQGSATISVATAHGCLRWAEDVAALGRFA
jgi:hypothetical protein